jgi:hypothetical protein
VTAAESLPEVLQSADYRFDGAIVLAERPLTALEPFLREIRAQGGGLKVVLKLAGCSQDDLGADFLKTADLVLNVDAPEADMLQTLESFLK